MTVRLARRIGVTHRPDDADAGELHRAELNAASK